jgi:hypothetical protein
MHAFMIKSIGKLEFRSTDRLEEGAVVWDRRCGVDIPINRV